MSTENPSGSVVFVKALESSFSKFCEVLKELVKYLFIFLSIATPIAIVTFSILYFNSNRAFEKTNSRLATQISAVLNTNSLYSEQKQSVINLLIQNYNIDKDDLNPVLNPNAKPISLESILVHFNIDGDSADVISNPNDDKEESTSW